MQVNPYLLFNGNCKREDTSPMRRRDTMKNQKACRSRSD